MCIIRVPQQFALFWLRGISHADGRRTLALAHRFLPHILILSLCLGYGLKLFVGLVTRQLVVHTLLFY